MNDHPERDDNFIAELRRAALRPPPVAWRRQILAAAVADNEPAAVRWYRSPFWQSMAALWAVLLVLWLDTRRPAPDTAVAGPQLDFSPAAQQDLQALLASLGNETRHHSPLP